MIHKNNKLLCFQYLEIHLLDIIKGQATAWDKINAVYQTGAENSIKRSK